MREFATFAPLIVLAVWIGLYPTPFLRRLETSVQHIVLRVSPEYTNAYAACNTDAAARTAGGEPADSSSRPRLVGLTDSR